MAQYTQVQQGIYEMGPDTNPGPPIYNPNDPSSFGQYDTGKPTPSPTTIALDTANQHMYQNVPTLFPLRTLQRQPLRRRLGKMGMSILGLGTIVILASCALLIYLWKGAEKARNRQPRGEAWDRIVFDGFASQVVTICSAAIRISMAFQIGLSAAAMAAVILETSGSRISDLARLSVSRAFGSSASPWEIFLITKSNRKTFIHCVVLVLIVILSLVMTFTSTILLFDFKTIPITAPNKTQSVAIGFDTSKEMALFAGISYWQSKPLAQWRFAETRPANQTLAPKDVADTGDVYRALIPMGNVDDRTSLEYYSGPTIVANMRTACVGPSFSNATLEYVYTGSDSTEGLYLQAELDASTGWKSGPRINGTHAAKISCRINNDWDQDKSTSWPLSLCSFNATDSEPADENLKNPLLDRPYAFHPVLLLNSSDILNTLIPTFDEETGDPFPFAVPDGIQMANSSRDGPWTTATAANGTELFQASVCFLIPAVPLLFNVTMSGRAIPSEPTSFAKWKNLQGKNGTDFLKQLGSGSSLSDYEARGILHLDIHEGPSSMASTKNDEWDANVYWRMHAILFDYSNSGGWTFNNDAIAGWFDSMMTWPAHPEHSHRFQTVLQKTNDPALAVQALFFRFYQMIFYDLLPYFTREQSAVTVNVKQVLIPNQWTGLIIIMAGVIMHLALTAITLVFFMVSTKVSMLGNAWQTVSQIISHDTSVVVDAVSNNGMRDVDVAKWAKSTACEEHIYGLSRSVDGGSKIQRR